MATSNSRDFDLDVAELVEEAYERCGLEIKTGYDAKTARRSLNLMFADWANRGINLWTVQLGTQALTAGTTEYTLTSDVVDLLEVVVRRNNTDFQVQRISRSDYQNLPNKTTSGRPSSIYVDKQIAPKINLWPAPENSTDVLRYYFIQRIQDADAAINNMDAPFRFLPCMAAGLAYYLSVKKAPDRVQLLKSIYEEEFQRASDMDQDRVPTRLTPSLDYLRVN
jgi:hypothetical protein|tara:strand:- start:7072 stop:7740 length:669 start_codon:yes stop_codon:yes gene_type:complete